MNIKTTTKGAEIIELIQYLVEDRNFALNMLYRLDARELEDGGLTLVNKHRQSMYRRQLVFNDSRIADLRQALDREHLSMAEALGVW